MMYRFLLIFLVLIPTSSVFAQQWQKQTFCSSDTLIVEPHLPKHYRPEKHSQIKLEPYKIVQCRTRSDLALRLEFAVSSYTYGKRTASWIGNHAGPNFNLALAYDNINFGLRFKPWTVDLKKEMTFNGTALPTTADLNSIKVDYYVGYSLDFDRLISLEPYVGYNSSSFVVINEDELKQEYTFEKSGGLIAGTTLNKYIMTRENGYFVIFGTAGYSLVNFEKIHPDLDNGYFEWSLGIAFKGYFTKFINKRVD